MQDKTILIVDDEPEMRDMLAQVFSRAGAQVVTAASGGEALRQFQACPPDLVVLDLMLPDMDGLETCARLRQVANVPVVMLTALSRDQDMVAGLDCADDYITKPVSAEVLLARTQAVLRRCALPPVADKPTQYDDGSLHIDLERRQVHLTGAPLHLTALEFRLLACLVRFPDQVRTYAQILEQVWGPQYVDSPQYVHVYMAHLRRKLEEDPARPRYLVTVHGVGYVFRPGGPNPR